MQKSFSYTQKWHKLSPDWFLSCDYQSSAVPHVNYLIMHEQFDYELLKISGLPLQQIASPDLSFASKLYTTALLVQQYCQYYLRHFM